MKTCTKCGGTFPLKLFYKEPKTGKRRSECKTCKANRLSEWKRKNREHVREYEREHHKVSHHRIQKNKRFRKRYAEKFPERVKAVQKVNNAIRDKRLFRKPCEVCGNQKSEAHHWDYSKPLEVSWFCKPHHWYADRVREEL
jgi:hypothetical protein